MNKLRKQLGGGWLEYIADMWHRGYYGTPMFTNDGFDNRSNYQYHGDVFMGSEMQQL